jgi:hypothetical protein
LAARWGLPTSLGPGGSRNLEGPSSKTNSIRTQQGNQDIRTSVENEESTHPMLAANDLRNVEAACLASYFSMSYGREFLDKILSRHFSPYAHPTALHSCLARIQAPMLIVTTAFDSLMEAALLDAGREFDIVSYCNDTDRRGKMLYRRSGAEPKLRDSDKLEIDLSEKTVVYKMFGSARCPFA